MSFKLMFCSIISAASLAFTGSSYAACIVKGEAAIRTATLGNTGSGWNMQVSPVSTYGWDDTEIPLYHGTSLGSGIGGDHEGSDLVFRGRPTVGGMAYGIYEDIEGTKTGIQATVKVSINWTPDAREVCTKHKFDIWKQKRRCVQKGIETYPTSFVVDITTNAGQNRHYVKQFTNVNQLKNAYIDMPTLICAGPIRDYEVRVLDLNGGEVEFRVHSVELFKGWRY